MIDKTKILAEIERLMYAYNLEADIASTEDAVGEKVARWKYDVCKMLTDFINSLPEEPVSEKKCIFTKDNYTDEDRKVLCEDCKEKCEYNKKEEPVSDDLEEAAEKYAYELFPSVGVANTETELAFKAGAKWKEKQMMMDATDVTVHIDAGNYPYISQLELYDYDKDVPLAKEGDKVKIIVIK